MVAATSVNIPQTFNINLGSGGDGGRGGGVSGGRGTTKGVKGGIGADGTISGQLNKDIKKVPKDIKKSTKAARIFNMELLGTMFFGMQIQRIFGGWVNSVLQMTGIFDVFKGVLIAILIPVLMPMIKMLIKGVKIFMGLPKWVKNFVGALIIGTALFGTILFLGSQFLLFLGAIAAMIVGVIALVGTLIAGGTGLAAMGSIVGGIISLLGFILLISAAIISMFAVWVSWVNSLDGSLRNVLDTLASISSTMGFLGLGGYGFGALTSNAAGNIMGGSRDVNIVQNNIGGLQPTAEANRQNNMLFTMAKGLIGGLAGG